MDQVSIINYLTPNDQLIGKINRNNSIHQNDPLDEQKCIFVFFLFYMATADRKK